MSKRNKSLFFLFWLPTCIFWDSLELFRECWCIHVLNGIIFIDNIDWHLQNPHLILISIWNNKLLQWDPLFTSIEELHLLLFFDRKNYTKWKSEISSKKDLLHLKKLVLIMLSFCNFHLMWKYENGFFIFSTFFVINMTSI